MTKQYDVVPLDLYMMRHHPPSKIVIAVDNFSVRWGGVIYLCYPMRIPFNVLIF